MVRFLALFARILPDSGGSTEHRFGHESETPFTLSPIDALAHRATVEQNEAIDQHPSHR